MATKCAFAGERKEAFRGERYCPAKPLFVGKNLLFLIVADVGRFLESPSLYGIFVESLLN